MSARSFAARPESVSVVGWLLVVFGGIGLAGSLMSWSMQDWPLMQQQLALYHYPVSFRTMLLVGLAGAVVHVLCGAAVLRRWGSARYVFVAWSVPMAVYTLWISPYLMFVIPTLLLMVAAIVVLFLPANNRWFAGTAADANY